MLYYPLLNVTTWQSLKIDLISKSFPLFLSIFFFPRKISPDIESSSVKILLLSEFTCNDSSRLSRSLFLWWLPSSSLLSPPLLSFLSLLSDGSILLFLSPSPRGVPSIVSRNVPPQYVAGSDGNHGETS